MESPTDKIQFGNEADGDPALMSRRMVAAWTQVCRDFGQNLVIIQGAFKDGKGAKASAGYHDKSGAIDIRMRTLTPDEREDFIRVARAIGWAAWVRDEEHGGFDLHAHLALLDEPNVDGQLQDQMDSYLAGGSGGNGLTGKSRGHDYHPRPHPIPIFDYDAWLRQENDVQLSDKVKLTDGTADALGFKRGTEVSVGDSCREPPAMPHWRGGMRPRPAHWPTWPRSSPAPPLTRSTRSRTPSTPTRTTIRTR